MAAKRPEAAETDAQDLPICGVIMPISSTANHSEAHWSDVQTLLHRAIGIAGFRPINVWENTSADRISERIVANIFDQPLVIADISDLNPNVMLELGLRLASKRPTIVIVNSGGSIPFDIRDFHVIAYPSDLNVLGMEDFFSYIDTSLNEKWTAYKSGEYQPFLGKVVVDVISPGHREVSVDVAIVDRLDEIYSKISKFESNYGLSKRVIADEDKSVTISRGNICYFSTTGSQRMAIHKFKSQPGVINVSTLGRSGAEFYLAVKIADDLTEKEADQLKVDLKNIGRGLGCSAGIRGDVLRHNDW